MSAHARLSASGSHQWMNCPGSLRMEDSLPKNLREGKSSSYAQLGTAAHGLLERCLLEDKQPGDFIDFKIKVLDDGISILKKDAKVKVNDQDIFLIDDDMVEAVLCATDYVRQTAEENGAKVKAEQRVNLTFVGPNMFGTTDVEIDDWPALLEIVDYKHGQGVAVEAEDNSQLMYYALGVAALSDFSHEEVKMTIIQPRCPHPSGGIRSHTISMAELLEFKDKITKAVELEQSLEIKENGVPVYPQTGEIALHAGVEQCRWCKALPLCPEARRAAEETAMVDFADDPEESSLSEVSMDNWDPEVLSQNLKWIPFLDLWSKKVMATGLQLLQNGDEVPGYKLIQKTKNRDWNHEDGDEGVIRHLIGKLDLDPELLKKPPTPAKMKSPSEVEKIPAKNLPKGVLKKDVLAAVKEVVHKPLGDIAMVPESHASPAYVPDGGTSDFDGVEE